MIVLGDNALDRCGMQTASVIYVADGTDSCFVERHVGGVSWTKAAVDTQLSQNPLTSSAQGLWRKGPFATCLALVRY